MTIRHQVLLAKKWSNVIGVILVIFFLGRTWCSSESSSDVRSFSNSKFSELYISLSSNESDQIKIERFKASFSALLSNWDKYIRRLQAEETSRAIGKPVPLAPIDSNALISKLKGDLYSFRKESFLMVKETGDEYAHIYLKTFEDTIRKLSTIVTVKPDTGTRVGLKQGTSTLDSGMSVNIYNNICVNGNQTVFVAKDDNELAMLTRCCDSSLRIHDLIKTCPSSVISLCLANTEKVIDTLIWPASLVRKKGLRTLEGISYWLYTPSKQEHVGHLVNRLMQTFHMLRDNNLPRADWLVSSRLIYPESQHTQQLTKGILKEMISRTFWRRDIETNMPEGILCMKTAIEIDTAQYERVMFTPQQGHTWRKYVVDNFPLDKTAFGLLCPPPKAVVLQRLEGSGLRQILNHDVLNRVLKRNGILSYENVTVTGEDDTATHIKVFSEFGLMIASHSSQLKNLIFTRQNAIVIEVRGTPSGYLDPSPFQVGMEELDIIFELNQDHIPDLSSCPAEVDCKISKKYKTDFWLIEEQFEAGLRNALKRQKEKCGNVWSQPV
eukprot:CFRG2515T1